MMLTHRPRVEAHLVGTWQERPARTPVNYDCCYYYYCSADCGLRRPANKKHDGVCVQLLELPMTYNGGCLLTTLHTNA